MFGRRIRRPSLEVNSSAGPTRDFSIRVTSAFESQHGTRDPLRTSAYDGQPRSRARYRAARALNSPNRTRKSRVSGSSPPPPTSWNSTAGPQPGSSIQRPVQIQLRAFPCRRGKAAFSLCRLAKAASRSGWASADIRAPSNTRGRIRPTRFASGWRLTGACKTQYASLHGWEHFKRCHLSVIAALRA